MSDIDVNDLMNQMSQNYPEWVNKAIGKDIKALEKAISNMNKNIAIGNKEAIRAEKEKKKRDKEIKDDVVKAGNNIAKAQERYAKAQEQYLKKMEAAKEAFFTGDARGAMENFKSGLKSGVTGLGKLGTALNVGSLALTAVVGVSKDLYDEMSKSRKSYSDITAAGIMVSGGFMGLRKAAVDGQQSVQSLTEAMKQSTSAIASMGVDGAAKFAAMSKKLNDVDKTATKFGMNLGDINKYLIDYLDNQKVIGTLNRLTDKQNELAINKSISQLSAFAGILGKSREQILKDSQQMFKDPSMRNIMARTLQAANITGDRAVQTRQNYSTLSQATNSVMNPETAQKMLGAIFSSRARKNNVVDFDVGRTQESIFLEHMAPQGMQKMVSLVERLEQGEIEKKDFNKYYIDALSTMQKELASQNLTTQGILINGQEAHAGFKAITDASLDFQQSIAGIPDLFGHLTKTMEEAEKISEKETDAVQKGIKAMENTENAVNAVKNSLYDATTQTAAFAAAVNAAAGAVDAVFNSDKVDARMKAIGEQRIAEVNKISTSQDTKISTAAQAALDKKAENDAKIAEIENRQYGPDEEYRRRIDQREIDLLKMETARAISSAPKMAEGGVARKRMLAEIAEAGSPEMVMPLDPSLHNMAKYNAEMMVDIYGPFQRQLFRNFSGYLFKSNADQIDNIFTKTLSRFFFTKNDVIQELTAASAGQGSLATQNLMRIMGMDVNQSSGGSFTSNRQADADYATSIGSGQTKSTGAAKIESESGRRIYQKLLDKGLQPHIASAFVHNFMDESGFNSGINEKKPLVPGSRGGYGLYQLTGPRRKQYEAFAKKNGYRFDDEDAQIEFMMQELKTTEKDAWDIISRSKNTAEAAQSIVKNFLRPSPQHRNSRMAKYGRLQDGPIMGSSNGVSSSDDYLFYTNKNATRNKPIDSKLKDAMSFVGDMGLKMEVYSGGQDGIGEGPRRTGSTRHDHGNAADVKFYKDGQILDFNNPEHRPIFEEIVTRARQRGVTGIGAGANYMGTKSMHVGFGDTAVWGAKGEKAPSWLSNAFYNGKNYPDLVNTNNPQLAGYSPGSTSFGMLGKSGGTMMKPGGYEKIDWNNPYGSEKHDHSHGEAMASTIVSTSPDFSAIIPIMDKLNRNIEELTRAYRKGTGVLSP